MTTATLPEADGAEATDLTAAPPPAGLRSALYEGTLSHRRHIDVGHRFSQPVLMAYLDLDELPEALDGHPLWSARRPAPVRFRRRDMHGDRLLPLDVAVRCTVAEHLRSAPRGPIRVLTHLRHWGWTFNPISLYLCFDEADTRVETILAEVTNTPWHERHAYVLPVGDPDQLAAVGVRFAKELHVSPFMDLDLDHVLRVVDPGGDRMRIEMDDLRRPTADGSSPGAGHAEPTASPDELDEDRLVFSARLALRRLPLERAVMGAALRRHGLASHRISTGIYTHALRLWRQGAPFRHHPHRSAR